MSPDPGVAAKDLVYEAALWLRAHSRDDTGRVAAIELATPATVALGEPTKALWRRMAGAWDANLVAAARHFAAAVLNALPEAMRVTVGFAQRQGGVLWAYVRPITGDATLGIVIGGSFEEITRRTAPR
jgi:hypothetical protein